MYLYRRHVWSLVLALVSIAAGLVLLAQAAGLAIGGMFIQFPALLIVYGLVVAWWHTKRAILVFEVQTARAVHRALRSSSSHRR